MLNKLTPEELSKALSGLSLDEKRELLELLEVREERKPEPVVDDRPPWWKFIAGHGAKADAFNQFLTMRGEDPATLPDGDRVDSLWDEFSRDWEAALPPKSEAYKRALAAHEAAYEKYYAELDAAEPPAKSGDELAEWMRQHKLSVLAQGHAIGEGFPHPAGSWLDRPEPASPPRDQLDATRHVAMRRSNTPRGGDLLLDDVIGETEDRERREAAERADRAAAAEEAHEAKMLPYRDKSPSGMPPSWPDS